MWWKVQAGEAIEPISPRGASLARGPHAGGDRPSAPVGAIPGPLRTTDAGDCSPQDCDRQPDRPTYFLGERTDETFSDEVVAQLKALNEKEDEIEKGSPRFRKRWPSRKASRRNLKIHLRGSHTTLGEEVGPPNAARLLP